MNFMKHDSKSLLDMHRQLVSKRPTSVRIKQIIKLEDELERRNKKINVKEMRNE